MQVEQRLPSFLRHERMAIAMTLAEYTHHSPKRHKKAAMSSENSVEGQLMEDGVFPEMLQVMPVPLVKEHIVD